MNRLAPAELRAVTAQGRHQSQMFKGCRVKMVGHTADVIREAFGSASKTQYLVSQPGLIVGNLAGQNA
jgi:hypothetical protein